MNMIRKIFLIITLLYTIHILHAQDDGLIYQKWSYNTSFLMPVGKWESGIFQPFRYGWNKKIEVYTHVLMLPLIPGLGAKVALGEKNGFILSSDHFISCPTPFLNMMSRKGIGGLISPQYDCSFILSVNNSLMISHKISSSVLASTFAGFTFALRGSKPDPQSTIDLPLFYPRMAHYYEGTSIKFGASVKGTVGLHWLYEECVQALVITRTENNFFFENSGTIMWASKRSLRIRGGYVLAFGRYPYITPKWQMWPTLDFVFGGK